MPKKSNERRLSWKEQLDELRREPIPWEEAMKKKEKPRKLEKTSEKINLQVQDRTLDELPDEYKQPLITIKQLAHMLSIPEMTIRIWLSRGNFPFPFKRIKINRAVRFRLKDVANYLNGAFEND